MNTLGNITLSGGTLTTNNGFNSTNESFYLKGGTITVSGSSASTINTSGSTFNGIQLASSTTFNVGNVTGGGTDLTVSAALLDRPSNDSGTGFRLRSATRCRPYGSDRY